MNSNRLKVTENVIDFYFRVFRKSYLLIQFSQIGLIFITPAIYQKMSIINCSRNAKDFKAIYFFFENRKFQKKIFFSSKK